MRIRRGGGVRLPCPQVLQVKLPGMPAHVRQTGRGSVWLARPGRTPSCPQLGQMPWVRIGGVEAAVAELIAGPVDAQRVGHAWHRLHRNGSVGDAWSSPRGGSPVWVQSCIADHPRSPGPHRLVEFDNVRCGGRGCLRRPSCGGRRSAVTVTRSSTPQPKMSHKCSHQLQRNPFGALVNHPIDLGSGQLDAALGEPGDEVGAVVHAVRRP